jgi:D-alanyl-D-alanine carboxypeptidase (penicillin-binding protein 5/6)
MAEYLYGSEEVFVDKMNKKAQELGMDNTNFVNCTGLPKQGQYSTAKDVSIMFSELIKHDEYFAFSNIWMDEINHSEGRKTEISNTNKLIRFYEGCDGGKTGYTAEAGHCLAACAKRNGMRLISVVINSPDSKTRFKEVSSMFNYGFANYVNKLIIDNNKPLELSVEVDGGKKDSVLVKAERPVYLFMKKNEKRSVDIDFLPNKNIVAPLSVGDAVGEIAIYENGIQIDSVKIVCLEDVEKASYFDIIQDVIENWALI